MNMLSIYKQALNSETYTSKRDWGTRNAECLFWPRNYFQPRQNNTFLFFFSSASSLVFDNININSFSLFLFRKMYYNLLIRSKGH